MQDIYLEAYKCLGSGTKNSVKQFAFMAHLGATVETVFQQFLAVHIF